MSRNDIANLLGMAVETISRLFSQFQEQGLLRVERKHVQIRDLPALQALANRCTTDVRTESPLNRQEQ